MIYVLVKYNGRKQMLFFHDEETEKTWPKQPRWSNPIARPSLSLTSSSFQLLSSHDKNAIQPLDRPFSSDCFPLFPDRLTLLPLIISVCSWAQAQTLAPIIPYSTHVKGLTPTHIPYNHSQKARNFIQWPSDPRKSGQHHQHLVLLFLEDGMTESRN